VSKRGEFAGDSTRRGEMDGPETELFEMREREVDSVGYVQIDEMEMLDACSQGRFRSVLNFSIRIDDTQTMRLTST
jgi:methyl coenzyme M reductase gamma subunit